MKSLSLFLLITVTLLSVTACRSPHYKMQLRDGREVLAITPPEFQTKTGYYRFRNLNGKDSLLMREEVLLIEQL
jgi:hypothetical protein